MNYFNETGYSTANVSFYEAASVGTGISLAIQLIKTDTAPSEPGCHP